MNPVLLTQEMLSQQLMQHHQHCGPMQIMPDPAHAVTEVQRTRPLDPLTGIVNRFLPEVSSGVPGAEYQMSGADCVDIKTAGCADRLQPTIFVKTEDVSEAEVSSALQVYMPRNDVKDLVKVAAGTMHSKQNCEDGKKELEYLNDINSAIGDKSPSKKSLKVVEMATKDDLVTSDNAVKLGLQPKPEPADTGAAETGNMSLFEENLELDAEGRTYENLFNGNSDEHYFQAFKENNLHLIGDLNGHKGADGNGDEIMKLLHSPLDFLNDKFLR